MKADLDRAVRCFREGALAAGSDALVRFIDGFSRVVAGASNPRDRDVLARVLKALAEAQERGDFNYVADLLEFELRPLFD
jgi:hypothetical protein